MASRKVLRARRSRVQVLRSLPITGEERALITSGLGANAGEGSGSVPAAAGAGEANLHLPVRHPVDEPESAVDAEDFMKAMQVQCYLPTFLPPPALLHVVCFILLKMCGKLFTTMAKSVGEEVKHVRLQVKRPPVAGECASIFDDDFCAKMEAGGIKLGK